MAGTDMKGVYEVDVQTKGADDVDKAADALEKLGDAIDADTKQISAMQKALRNLKGDTQGNAGAIDQLKQRIDAQKKSVAQSTAAYLQMGGAFKKRPKPPAPPPASPIEKAVEAPKAVKPDVPVTPVAVNRVKAFRDQMKGMLGDVSKLPGPVGQLGGMVTRLGGSLTSVAMLGAAAAAALVAVAAAVATLTAKLVSYAITVADTMRSERLQLEGLSKMRFMFQRTADSADHMLATIDKVAASTPIARGKLVEMTTQLEKMGLRGNNLTAALEGMAIKFSTQGQEAANNFAGWAAGANMTGRSVQKLADNVKARLGGIAQKQMESLTVQTLKQQEAMQSLFGALKIDAFLKARKVLVDMFSQSTESGRALKGMLTRIIQPLIDGVTAALPIVKKFFVGIILASLDLGIAFLRVRKWWRQTFGKPSGDSSIDWLRVALVTGKAVVIAFAVALGIVGTVLYVIARPVIFLWGHLARMVTMWSRVKDAISTGDWAGAGKAMLDGLLGSLKAGAKLILGFMYDLGALAVGAFKKAIGASSPAKAFIAVGKTIPEGVGVGVREETPAAQDAVDDMIKIPPPSATEGAARGAAGAAVGGRGAAQPAGNTFNIGDININAGGTSNPRELAAQFRVELERVLESVAIQMGAPMGAT